MTAGAVLGRFVDRHTIRFDIEYPQPADELWTAITDPDALAVWFMRMEIEQVVGGRVTLQYTSDAALPLAEGVVTALERGALIEYRFEDGPWRWPASDLSFRVRATANGSRLTFSQRLEPDEVHGIDPAGQIGGPGTHHPGTCAGWEGFFREGLSRFLDGRPEPLYDEADDALMDEREVRYRSMIERLVASDWDLAGVATE